MGATKIEWAERVWNPVTGCTQISEGCANCYAKRMALRLQKMPKTKVKYRNGFKPTFHPYCLVDIDPREKPALIFVGSMSDIFHRDFQDFDIGLMFGRMAVCSQHRFMVLTKRIGRWLSLSVSLSQNFCEPDPWPPPNVAFGASAENQAALKKHLLHLKHCEAAYRFLSLEPLLGPIDLAGADPGWKKYIDLVIVGGESGPGARPMNPKWVRKLRDECLNAGVPFCFKQWGKWSPEPIYNSNPPKWPPPEGPIKRRKGPAMILFPDGEMTLKCGKKAAGRHLGGEIYDGAIRWEKLNIQQPTRNVQ